jgi:tetratricopeptide (TPR) repeat protein
MASPVSPTSSDIGPDVSLEAAASDQLFLFALRAGRLARLGHVAKARELLSRLRIKNNNSSPELTGWIILAEAIVDRSESYSDEPRKKFVRAYAVAKAAGNKTLLSHCAAWLAAAEFISGDIDSAANHCIEALNLAERDASSTSRALTVVADCFAYSGNFKRSSKIYAEARGFAVADRDLSMQSVIIFNQSAFQICEASLRDAFQIPVDANLSELEMHLSSSENLDKGIDNKSLHSLTLSLKGQLLVLRKRWPEALAIFEQIISGFGANERHAWQWRLRAERAYCLARTGEFVPAANEAKKIEKHFASPNSTKDDLAATEARLANIGSIVNDPDLHARNLGSASIHLSEYRSNQRHFLTILDDRFPAQN